MRHSQKPLAGKRILVPPARPEANPLLGMLERKGAELIAFPLLKVEPPADYAVMDKAIHELKDFDWIIFSGSNCVAHFLERLIELGLSKEGLGGARIGAIGYGAVSALKKEGIAIDYAPHIHTAEGVTEGLGEVSGSRCLLVRVEGACPDLPKRLKALGAEVTEVPGYRMDVAGGAEMAQQIFDERLDMLALANPTAVRFLVKKAKELNINLKARLEGVTIAAVGPATAKTAKDHGLLPNLISKGHIADLAESLAEHFEN